MHFYPFFIKRLLALLLILPGLNALGSSPFPNCRESLNKEATETQISLFTIQLDEKKDLAQSSLEASQFFATLPSKESYRLKIDTQKISRNDFGYTASLLVNQLTLDFATKGLRLSLEGPPYSWSQRLRMGFRFRQSKIIEFKVSPDLPSYAVNQAQLMSSFLHGILCCQNLTASKREDYSYSSNPKFKKLTPRELDKIEPGIYSFVYINNEPFLRLGNGHHYIGERRDVFSAGDIAIKKNIITGKNDIDFINIRSDTYRPLVTNLIAALLGAWRQGIYPVSVRLLNWDNTPSAIGF